MLSRAFLEPEQLRGLTNRALFLPVLPAHTHKLRCIEETLRLAPGLLRADNPPELQPIDPAPAWPAPAGCGYTNCRDGGQVSDHSRRGLPPNHWMPTLHHPDP